MRKSLFNSRKLFTILPTENSSISCRSYCFPSTAGYHNFMGMCVVKKYFKQECIPVGCIPCAAVAVWWGVSAQEGVCLERGEVVMEGGGLSVQGEFA